MNYKLRNIIVYGVVALGLVLSFALRDAFATVPGSNEAVDMNDTGGTPTNVYDDPAGGGAQSISQNGRYIVFESDADNLVSSPTIEDSYYQIYLRDRYSDTTTLISQNSSNDPGNASSTDPQISANGRYIVYVSGASNLVSSPYDGGGYNHVFIYDTQTGTTQWVDQVSDGPSYSDGNASYPTVSADGNYVVFEYYSYDSDNLVNSPSLSAYTDYIFEKNMSTGAISLVSIGTDDSAPNASSGDPAIDCAGDQVVYDSEASNIVSDGGSGHSDVYLVNMMSGTTTDITDGANANSWVYSNTSGSISCDGEYIGVTSDASNLSDANTTNGYQNAFEYNRINGDFVLLSQSSDSTEANSGSYEPTLSDDGRYAVFESQATNLVSNTLNAYENVYLRDIETGTTQLISEDSDSDGANCNSEGAIITADGRYVTFNSCATNLVSDYPDVDDSNFLYVSQTGTTDDY